MEAMALTKTIFAGQPTEPDHHNVPTAVFSHPQISTVGMSEEQVGREMLSSHSSAWSLLLSHPQRLPLWA